MQQTSAVRSSIASAKRSAPIEPSAPGRHVDDLGAAQLLRVRDLADRRELVLARSRSGSAPVERQRGDERAHALRHRGRHGDVVGVARGASPANAARNASFRSTQNSHSAPFASQPASHPSTATRTRCDSAPCEHELR